MAVTRANPLKASGTVSVRYIVQNIKNRRKEYSATDYKHIEQLVIDAIGYLNIFTLDTIEVSYIDVDSTGVIELPEDYVDYTKIGVVDRNMKLWTLTLDKSLVRLPVEECGLPLDRVLTGHADFNRTAFPYPTTGYFWSPHFHYGNFIDNYYGMGGGFNRGYYNIDRAGRRLLTRGLPEGTTVVLEYKSSGVGVSAGTYVPRQALEAIIAKVMWVETEYSVLPGNPQYWEKRFYDEENMLINLEYTRTMQEHLDSLYAVWTQGPKR
jgi:hypothetical protein